MTKPKADKPAAPAKPHERDFYFDELMTAQPDATRDYLRARLLQTMRPQNIGRTRP